MIPDDKEKLLRWAEKTGTDLINEYSRIAPDDKTMEYIKYFRTLCPDMLPTPANPSEEFTFKHYKSVSSIFLGEEVFKVSDIKKHMVARLKEISDGIDEEDEEDCDGYYDQDGHCGSLLADEISDFWEKANLADVLNVFKDERSYDSIELDLEGGRDYILSHDLKLYAMVFNMLHYDMGLTVSDIKESYEMLIENLSDFNIEFPDISVELPDLSVITNELKNRKLVLEARKKKIIGGINSVISEISTGLMSEELSRHIPLLNVSIKNIKEHE